MSYYLLADTIQPCTKEELLAQMDHKYVAVLTTPEWSQDRECFDMGIELEPDVGDIHNTKAEVNYDSLTGTFQLPDRENIEERDFRFAFALDEKGIVFIDDSGKAEQMINAIRRRKRWRKPSLERFLYDFLEQIVENDLAIMERYEEELNQIEDAILASQGEEEFERVNEIHSDIRKLLVHYEQIIDALRPSVYEPYGAAARFRGFASGSHDAGAGPLSCAAGGAAEPDHDASHRCHNNLYAPDTDCRLVRHEFPLYAGIGVALRIPFRDIGKHRCRSLLPGVFPKEKVAVDCV